jgi:hypothetical protein
MLDGYEEPAHEQEGTDSADASESPTSTRAQSRIQFPYMDLDAAIDVARKMRDRGGSTAFTKDQIAAALGHSVTSGAFATKMHAARMFGVVEAGAGRFKVTQLGFDAVDPDEARASAARVEAFLRVPLYKRTYEEYRGKTLPSRPHGLERVFVEFGVAPKRGGNARLAFERSARQAGFYEHGDDRLVAPIVSSAETPRTAELAATIEPITSKATAVTYASVLKGPGRHHLIEGLFQELPDPGVKWGTTERARWLRLAASVFDVLYPADDGKTFIIDVRALREDVDGKSD